MRYFVAILFVLSLTGLCACSPTAVSDSSGARNDDVTTDTTVHSEGGSGQGDAGEGVYAPDTVLLVFAVDATPEQATKVLEDLKATADQPITEDTIKAQTVFVLSLPEGSDVEAAVAQCKKNPTVNTAQPDYVYSLVQ